MHERIAVRRQAIAAARRRRRTHIAVGAAALVVAVAVVATVVTSPLFAVDEVRAVGVDGARAAEAVEASGLTPGENMLLVDTVAAEASVAALPWVHHADVQRVPPSTLQIDVVPRQPVAVLQLADASWLLDREGVLVEGGSRDGLVVIEAPGLALPPVGQRVSDPVVEGALTLAADLPPSLAARLERVEGGEDGLRMHLRALGDDPAAWVRLGTVMNLPARARAVELVLDRLATAPELAADLAAGASEIDVRAPLNPVLAPLE